MAGKTNLRSGLPISDELMEEFYNEGGVIDLSKVSFPTKKTVYDNMLATIIYLRNISLMNYELTFTEMDYEHKSNLLIAYLDSPVSHSIEELNETWLTILYACARIKRESDKCILNDLELITFVADKRDYLMKLATFIISLPLYLITRLDADVSIDKLEVVEDEFETANLMHIIQHPDFDDLTTYIDENHPPKFYSKVFTVENTELFESLQHLTIAKILMGIVSEDGEHYLQFLKDITFKEIKEEE